MDQYLKLRHIVTLSFMTFALFVGAGNIIFPPMVGLQSGNYVWIAAIGFLITSVFLPILTVIALSKSGGNINSLFSPVGKVTGMLLSTACYLTVGPFFAIPRTATVSFEVGIASMLKNGNFSLFLYSIVYFLIIAFISFYPSKLLNIIGSILAPIKIIFLVFLAISAVIWPVGPVGNAIDSYKNAAFANGFINGYLTMDTLGAIVFGIVILKAVRSCGIREKKLLTRYTTYSGVIAGIGLIILYLALFYLGSNSAALFNHQENVNGAIILYYYIQHTFGSAGNILLTILIFLSCLVTAIGLTCACAEFLSQHLNFSYRALVFILVSFSIVISNFGLSYLTKISIPVLKIIYPPCIVLVLLSFTHSFWNNSSKIIAPTAFVSLIFGIFDGVQELTLFSKKVLNLIHYLPFSEMGLSWFIPTLLVLFLFIILDRRKRTHTPQ